jgi:hypothetical protein
LLSLHCPVLRANRVVVIIVVAPVSSVVMADVCQIIQPIALILAAIPERFVAVFKHHQKKPAVTLPNNVVLMVRVRAADQIHVVAIRSVQLGVYVVVISVVPWISVAIIRNAVNRDIHVVLVVIAASPEKIVVVWINAVIMLLKVVVAISAVSKVLNDVVTMIVFQWVNVVMTPTAERMRNVVLMVVSG